MGVKNPQKITLELRKKIYAVANREGVKDLSNAEIAKIVNKEYLEETGKTSNVKEGSVRKYSEVKKGMGNIRGNPLYPMDKVRANLRAHNLSLEGTESELRRRSSQATARANLSPRVAIGAFLSDRARNSTISDVKETAARLHEKYKNDPSFPSTQDQIDEIDSLKRGSGYTAESGRPPGSVSRGHTFISTPEAGPVPKELRIFRSHQDIVNAKATELFDLKIITEAEYNALRVSSGHGLAKADPLWPQLRNVPRNVYLQPLSENLKSGPRATQKDIHEFIRMNERMRRVHGTDVIETGTSKSGMKLVYAINKILRDNDLDEIPKETIKFFKDSPSVRSWKPSGENVIDQQPRAKGSVSGDIKRSLMNLLESPAGKIAIKSGKYALRGLGIAGIPLSAKAAVAYQKEGHPYLATVAGLSAIPGISLPMLAAEGIGNIWNRELELIRKREEERGLLNYEPPKRKPGRGYGLLNN